MWEGWDAETDSSESSDEEDWINVDSEDDKDIVVSDSEDEGDKTEKPEFSESAEPLKAPRISTLATTKVQIIQQPSPRC